MTTEAAAAKKQRLNKFLTVLATATPKQRQELLAAAPNKVIRLLSEVGLNLDQKRLAVKNQKHLTKLRKQKKIIQKLAFGKSLESNRSLLVQKGRGPLVPLLIAAASGVLPSVIEGIVKLVKK